MSQHGSFSTGIISCDKCLLIARHILVSGGPGGHGFILNDKHFCAGEVVGFYKDRGIGFVRFSDRWWKELLRIKRHQNIPLRIISGRVGGLYHNEEFSPFDWGFVREQLEADICHDIRVVVFPDSDDPVREYRFLPKEAQG